VVCQERELALVGGKRIVLSTFMPDYGPQSEVLGFYVLTQDITAQKQAQRRLDFLAHHDTLTELPNRASFNARLTLAIARTRRHAQPFALMYLDIDKFKSINDTHGHGTGDQLLKAFARRLQENVRATDIVGRLGGDEFVVLAEDLHSAADGAALAAKIVAAMRLPFTLENMEIRTSTSVGVAICFQEHAHLSGASVLEWADQALYLAKQGGRNRYRIANADAGQDEGGTVTGESALA
jgi:diguanylate cyclase (GGDEF)-like protein